MKRRHLYVLLFGIPALLGAVAVTTLLFGAVAGALWLFAFGDNPWPASTDAVLGAALVVVCIALWLGLLAVAHGIGRKQEAQAALNPRHAMAAGGFTALLVLLIVSQQWRVGNLGTPSDGARCADFCRDKGFAGSGMPPQRCRHAWLQLLRHAGPRGDQGSAGRRDRETTFLNSVLQPAHFLASAAATFCQPARSRRAVTHGEIGSLRMATISLRCSAASRWASPRPRGRRQFGAHGDASCLSPRHGKWPTGTS